ncbi:MAG: hypothetical protein P1P89_14045 [Desulfobacterales bacterium]|nr:hypothetical protein [Desulfobacterales bacterium]
MSHIRIQVYEVQTPAEAEEMISLGVDHIGSVILSEADWKVDAVRETIHVTRAAKACSSLIPLFSDEDAILRLLDYYHPDIIHFCEDIAPLSHPHSFIDYLLKIQARVKDVFPEIRIMRSIPIVQAGAQSSVPTLQLARLFRPVSDLFLTDTYLLPAFETAFIQPPVKGFIGITGKICDWDIAAELVADSSIPVILAGGLSAQNIFAGIRQVRPAGVDSCTETNARNPDGSSIRFKKEPRRVKAFIEEVRRAERA